MKPKFIKDVGMRFPTKTSSQKRRFWLVECPMCNEEFEATAYSIKSGNTTKCVGCGNKHKNLKHGKKGTRLYNIWCNMKSRCFSKSNPSYHRYGRRGITVCDEWLSFESFNKWAIDNGYSKYLSIDRINNDGNYKPSNCRWANREIQNNNTRRLRVDNTTGFRGVKCKGDKFQTCVSISGKRKHIGTFSTPLEAALARDEFIEKNGLISRKNFT